MDFKLFSADDHMDLRYLPEDLWAKRVPAAYRERAPQLAEIGEGKRWVVDGRVFAQFKRRDTRFTNHFGKDDVVVEQEEGRWRPSTLELRLADMDRDRVEAHVLYGGLTAGFQTEDPGLNAVCLRAYNEWIAEFCQANPKRLIGLGILPVHDAKAAVEELYYCAKLGLRGVQFPPFDSYKRPWDEVWEPLWAASSKTGVPICFHIGGGTWSTRSAAAPDQPAGRGAGATYVATIPNQMDEVLCALILSGALMRHPNFHPVLAETSFGWIPYLLERMDRKYQERHIKARRDDAADLELPPSEYFKRQMSVTFTEDPIGIRLLEYLGPHTLMWGSDYPHPDSSWPNSHPTVDKMFAEVDLGVAKMILRENAIKLFG